ncbi:hypothetical protein D9613_007365 [Agrocybe pediades]|uniref:Uncharacterized protein n=1 Tax=Agrocybe pediades TaxID=84607 RepID=A0A8H4QNR0_9AGAR|nr:hypothetical protein D9613_007365 [Agrocybe pediades]
MGLVTTIQTEAVLIKVVASWIAESSEGEAGEVEEGEVNDGQEESQWLGQALHAFKQLTHEMPYPQFMHISPSIPSDHSFYVMGPSDVALNRNG